MTCLLAGFSTEKPTRLTRRGRRWSLWRPGSSSRRSRRSGQRSARRRHTCAGGGSASWAGSCRPFGVASTAGRPEPAPVSRSNLLQLSLTLASRISPVRRITLAVRVLQQEMSVFAPTRRTIVVPWVRRPAEVSHPVLRRATRADGRRTSTVTKQVKQLDRVIIRFAGDSGDGMQLTGDRFTAGVGRVRQRPVDAAQLPGRDPGARRARCPGSRRSRCTSPTTTSSRRATRPTCWWR